jgi:hypothetical protein
MLGDQYRADSKTVNREGYLYAKSLNLSGDGKDIWVFDIDETTLSNLPYYAKHGFGYASSSSLINFFFFFCFLTLSKLCVFIFIFLFNSLVTKISFFFNVNKCIYIATKDSPLLFLSGGKYKYRLTIL